MRVPVPVAPQSPIADVNHEAEKQFASSAGSAAALAGSALPPPLRHQMEAKFGADFSNVRIHQSAAPVHLGAVSFAHGNNIHFAPGHYDPHSQSGQELLGHELAHVVQQRAGRVAQNDSAGAAGAAGKAAAQF